MCEELLLEILILVQLVLGNLPFGDGTEYFVRTAARPRKVSRFASSLALGFPRSSAFQKLLFVNTHAQSERKPASWMHVISW